MPHIALDGQQIFVEVDDLTAPWETSEPVLLHHGYARCHHFWFEWVRELVGNHRCVRFDMRGHGQSDPLPADFWPNLDSLADDTIRIMDALDVEAVHFVGESLAGVVGIWLGAKYPDRMKSLVLLSTPVKVSPQGIEDFSAGAKSWEAAFDSLSPAQWARQTMGHRFDPAETDPAYIEWAVEQAGQTPVESLRRYARLIENLDLSGGLPAVRCPTLLVCGGSKLAPPEQAQFLRDAIPGARLEVLPDARHLVGYAKPAETAALAQEFWRSLHS